MRMMLLLLLLILGCGGEKSIKRILCGEFSLMEIAKGARCGEEVCDEAKGGAYGVYFLNSNERECERWNASTSKPGVDGYNALDSSCYLGAEEQFYEKHNITTFNTVGSYTFYKKGAGARAGYPRQHVITGCFIAK